MKLKSSRTSSRKQILIKEIKDNILILPGNQYRSVIETSSINFELKSEEEQDALIDNFQNFLNSLPCQLQILIRVREVDVDRYLEEFTKSNKMEEKIYKEQIENYSTFIKKLVSGNKILSRKFYVVIPYTPSKRYEDFNLIKDRILLNQDIVIKGFEKLGMKAKALNSFEIIELFYKFYNFDHIKSQELKAQTLSQLFNNSYAI